MALMRRFSAYRCANPRCHRHVSALRQWLFRPRSYALNGSPYCSENCLRPQLQSVLNHFIFRGNLSAGPLHRSTIGLILLDFNLITLPQLNEVLARQRDGDRRFFGEIVISLGFISEKQITLALSRQEGLPWLDLDRRRVDPAALQKVPPELAFCSLIMPLDFDLGLAELNVVAAAPVDRMALTALQQMNRCRVNCFIGPESKVKQLLAENYGQESASRRLERKSVPKPEDVYALREELMYQYRIASGVGMEVAPYHKSLWMRIHTPMGTRDFFYSISSEEEAPA